MAVKPLIHDDQIRPNTWVIEGANNFPILYKVKQEHSSGSWSWFIVDLCQNIHGLGKTNVVCWQKTRHTRPCFLKEAYITDTKEELEFLVTIISNVPEGMKQWLSKQ